jgi:hypothetical protein
LLQEGIDPRSAMNRSGPRAAVEVPVAGNSHNVAALIQDFSERHLRKRRKQPEYAERILQKELADWAHRDARTIKPREVIELLDALSSALPRSWPIASPDCAVPIVPVRHPPAQYLDEKRDALTQWADHPQALRDGKQQAPRQTARSSAPNC